MIEPAKVILMGSATSGGSGGGGGGDLSEYAKKTWVNQQNQALYDRLDSEKQNKLTAGDGVKIVGNTISATTVSVTGENLKFELE